MPTITGKIKVRYHLEIKTKKKEKAKYETLNEIQRGPRPKLKSIQKQNQMIIEISKLSKK